MEDFTSLAYIRRSLENTKVDIAKRALASSPSSMVFGFAFQSITIEACP
jgi:hypothetical protein